jgi:glyoxylase-like metal-dependent hydrolase (beta-lactamase superfamily II)
VVLRENGLTYFFAGDTSYTQQLMLDQKIDGVSLDAQSSQRTLHRIRQLAEQTPLVYVPSHDPESAQRLANKTTAIVHSTAQALAMPVLA